MIQIIKILKMVIYLIQGIQMIMSMNMIYIMIILLKIFLIIYPPYFNIMIHH